MVSNMVKQIHDNDAIIKLWQKCFGDTSKEIEFFLENCKNKLCIGIIIDNTLVSMLFLVDCICQGRKGKYIYAACTDSEQRQSGYMTALLDYSKEHYHNICLIPAEYKLIKYYKTRSFAKEISIDTIVFDETDEIKQYLFDGCALEKPQALCYTGE